MPPSGNYANGWEVVWKKKKLKDVSDSMTFSSEESKVKTS